MKQTLFDRYESDALFSEDGKYRYSLCRIWDWEKPFAMFIGLNPSTANKDKDDATIRQVKFYSEKFGYGGFYMMNLFAIVSTDPKILKSGIDAVGENDVHLQNKSKICDDIIFCCGDFKEARERLHIVRQMFPKAFCLGLTANGLPRHPCRLSHDIVLQDYSLK